MWNHKQAAYINYHYKLQVKMQKVLLPYCSHSCSVATKSAMQVINECLTKLPLKTYLSWLVTMVYHNEQ